MPNRLIEEQSPYLLQHAHNPVDWYPWCDEAFAIATERNKPVLVSIGYAACHWCHVMEHESFEDDGVAAFMNEHFVCIKVDREEHPDVDHIYMDAVQAISGSGGWPLNVFVTPERQPFYGGTYFPPKPAYSRPSWLQVLHRIVDLWHNSPTEVVAQTKQLTHYLTQLTKNLIPAQRTDADTVTCSTMAEGLLKQADKEYGGFGGAPKFPGTMAITLLLEHHYFTGHEGALQHAVKSMDSMADGGIYDQLGGGFARYATDRNWLVPHFEKMLYDNALLVALYSDAYMMTGNERYKQVVEETLTFIERELKDNTGGYYCAIDADSEGVEGKYYTWTWEEWIDVIGEDNDMAATYFGVSREGNWEGMNILHVSSPIKEIAKQYNCTEDEVWKVISGAKEKLFAARQNKVRPITDDKCLLSWNALMNIALVKAGIALHNEGYINTAVQHAEWMLEKFTVDNSLMRVWKKGIARIPAKLDDDAFLIQALLQLATATGNDIYIYNAGSTIERVIERFGHEDGYFYYTGKEQVDIPVRKVELYDGATPSANAVMANNLLLCGMYCGNTAYIARSEGMMMSMTGTATKHCYSYGYWATMIQRNVYGMKTVIFTGDEGRVQYDEMRRKFIPQAYLIMSKKEKSDISILENIHFENKKCIFVCSKSYCLPPVSSAEDAMVLIGQQ